MTVRVTGLAISEDISLIVKTGQRYSIQLIATSLIALTSYCFHCMTHLFFFFILERIFVVFVSDTLFDHIFSDTFGSLFIFTINFDLRIQFTSEPNKFSYWNTSSLIFELTNYFLVGYIKVWTIFGVITIIKLIFVGPNIPTSISSLYFITKVVCICK